jgi:hypothetical protein
MARTTILFDKPWKLSAWLLICSFSIYFFYFHHLLLNINSLLSSLSSDALKNYYTFFYHVVNDRSALHFEGMNYPFGEHVVYTDCQPILTFVLRLLPFTHPYLAGILHALIFLSYIITPVILFRILLRLELAPFPAFFIALAIAVLSPQYWRLDGHFALTYECVIPLAILLLLRFLNGHQPSLWWITAYNSILFLLHPYLGFGVSIFCFLALLSSTVLLSPRNQVPKRLLQSVTAGLLPIVLFRLFLFLTDPHQDRTSEPYGIDVSVASFASIFVANFGPFKDFMKTYLSNGPQEFEGLSYTGFFTVFLMAAFILLLPFALKKFQLNKALLCLLLSALLLLLFSCGLHNKALQAMHLHLAVFDQFRSLGRFAWFFYYMAPLFLAAAFYHNFKLRLQPHTFRYASAGFALCFFSLNMLEANDMLPVYVKASFKDRNIFRKELLTAEENRVISSIKTQGPQAIIPLPIYFVGNEVYYRAGGGNSMLSSMLYSFHANTPILGGSLSRTSISETEDGIELLNAYKHKRRAMELSSAQPYLVIKTKDHLMPDEERLFKKTRAFYTGDSLQFGYVTTSAMKNPELNPYVHRLRGPANNTTLPVIYVHAENRKPYLPSIISSYENALTLDSNVLQTGNYFVSLHYHFDKKSYKEVNNHLIIAKTRGPLYEWEYAVGLPLFSGFYKGFAVFEYRFFLDGHNKYEFTLKGEADRSYRISDLMIRPDTCDVMVVTGTDTLINNFPLRY